MSAFTHQEPETASNLTEVEAQGRSANVFGAHYSAKLSLAPASQSYSGVSIATFRVRKTSEEVFLNFTGKNISKIVINGSEVEPSEKMYWKSHRLHIDTSLLREDADGCEPNSVEIAYTNDFDHTGAGFHSFTDPEDNEMYCYTNFEPFEAHRLLPCFDQPDIKAAFDLEIVAPNHWVVVSNSIAEVECAQSWPGAEEEGHVLQRPGAVEASTSTPPASAYTFAYWRFATSPVLSTYLYALIGGPYLRFTDRHKDIPLGLFCRRSVAEHLPLPEQEELFTFTKQGLDFYEDFFGIAYPFGKYDQLFVPEFNEGAMENAGAVTFTDSYLFRDPPTESARLSRADTVLHEMAHMWFGDLVTMKWWDGLWLNESMATFMAAMAVAESTRFGAASWVQFNAGMKAWAYREDQLSTTHPIQSPVVDTDATFLNFDGVTYGKGAAVLKQLVARVGLPRFRAGMRTYFQRHKWGNTTLEDLLTAIQSECADGGVDLMAWSREWIETAGLNTLTPEWTFEGEGAERRIATFAIRQGVASPAHPTLRSHHVTIALMDKDGRVLREEDVLVGAQAVTVVEALRGCSASDVAWTFINHNDHAFAKVAVDESSMSYLTSLLRPSSISNSLLRQLLWRSLYDMVRDAQWCTSEFIRLVRCNIADETDVELVTTILRQCGATLANFVPDKHYVVEADRLFDLACSQVQVLTSAIDSSSQPNDAAGDWREQQRIVWAKMLVQWCASQASVEKLIALVDGGVGEAYQLPQDVRWGAARKCCAFGLPSAMERVEAELLRDSSDRGQRCALTARSAFEDAKADAWRRFNTTTTTTATTPLEQQQSEEEGGVEESSTSSVSEGSVHTIAADMAGFHQRNQSAVLQPYFELFFAEVRGVFKSKTREFATSYYYQLLPLYQDENDDDSTSNKLLLRLQELDSELGDEEKILSRLVKEEIDGMMRLRRCRACYTGPSC